jgi:glycosyltransferase 2 family protein
LRPTTFALLSAALLLIVNTLLSAFGWALLFERSNTLELLRGYFVSLPGKYVPGAVWQAVGQVSTARRSGISGSAASVAFPFFVLSQIAAAGTLGVLFAVTAVDAPVWLRVVSGLGVVSVALLFNRSWACAALDVTSRHTRLDLTAQHVPARSRLLGAYFCNLLGLGAASIAFAVVLRGIAPGDPAFASAAAAFGVAWGVGLLVIPVPAGLGIREGVLVLALNGSATVAAVVTASAIVRLVTIATEILVIGGSFAALRPRPDPPTLPTDRSK